MLKIQKIEQNISNFRNLASLTRLWLALPPPAVSYTPQFLRAHHATAQQIRGNNVPEIISGDYMDR